MTLHNQLADNLWGPTELPPLKRACATGRTHTIPKHLRQDTRIFPVPEPQNRVHLQVNLVLYDPA